MVYRTPHLSDFPTIGFIPAPGAADSMEAISDAFSDTAGILAEVDAILTGADDGEWRGKTAIAFRDVLSQDFQPKVANAHQSFSDASRALADWVAQMYEFQRDADTLEESAAEAMRNRDMAAAQLGALPPAPGPFDPEPETDEEKEQAEKDQESRERREESIEFWGGRVEAYRTQAHDLEQNYITAGRDTANRLRDAMELAPNEPGFWGKLAEAVGGFFDGLMDAIADIGDMIIAELAALAPILSVINNVLGLVAGVLAIASLFFPVLAPFALALGAVVLLTTYMQKVGETGSFTQALTDPNVIMAAVGVVCGAGSLAMTMATTGKLVGSTYSLAQSGTYMAVNTSRVALVSNTFTTGAFSADLWTSYNNGKNLASFKESFLQPHVDEAGAWDPGRTNS